MRCRSDATVSPLRVGIVNYLNSKPLAWSFLQGQAASGFAAEFLSPATVAQRLASAELDIGLIPSIEVQRIPGVTVLPDLCVAATEEVRSVILLSRCEPRLIRRLALDENSRTSAALVRIVLAERYGAKPETIAARPDLESMMSRADAALIIGDPALQVDRSGYRVLDLAAEWRRLTGRPFVFAVWALRDGVELGNRAADFERSLELGQREIETLIAESATELGIPASEIRHYLTCNLSYELGENELAGLEEFFTKAHFHGLIDSIEPLRLLSPCGSGSDSVE